MRTLVLIPCYNEEENIRSVVERLQATCPDVDYLVINDQLEVAVEELKAILRAEHCRPADRMGQILNK